MQQLLTSLDCDEDRKREEEENEYIRKKIDAVMEGETEEQNPQKYREAYNSLITRLRETVDQTETRLQEVIDSLREVEGTYTLHTIFSQIDDIAALYRDKKYLIERVAKEAAIWHENNTSGVTSLEYEVYLLMHEENVKDLADDVRNRGVKLDRPFQIFFRNIVYAGYGRDRMKCSAESCNNNAWNLKENAPKRRAIKKIMMEGKGATIVKLVHQKSKSEAEIIESIVLFTLKKRCRQYV